MILLKKIMKDNCIKSYELYTLIGCSRVNFEYKCSLRVDFKIEELEMIKNFFVELNIVTSDFDIGCFLESV